MPSQTEQLYAIELQNTAQPTQPRLFWNTFTGPYLTAFRSEAVKMKNLATDGGFKKARVVKLVAKFTWLLLLSSTLEVRCSMFDVPPLPKAVAPAPKTFHFAATAVATNGLESDYSKEVTTTNPAPTLAWDPSPTPACTYTIWRGRESGCYTNHWPAGTACVFSIPPVPLPTNRILTLTTLNATGLQYRPWGGTWFYARTTNLTLTNPPVGLQYRPLGRPGRPARAWITITNR